MIQLRKTIQVSKDDYDWFIKTYGPEANLSWALGQLLSEFRVAHVRTPQDYAKIAAKELSEQIEGQK